MKFLKDTWRGLVQRRLWPLAAVLLAALVAVPAVLARDADPVETPGPAAPVAEAGLQTMVSAASPAERERLRHVVGTRKDPFAPAHRAKQADDAVPSAATATSGGSTDATASAAPVSTSASPAPATSSTPAPSSGASEAASAPAPAAPTVDRSTSDTPAPTERAPEPAAKAPKKRYVVYSADVRFGRVDAAERPEVRTIRRLRQLPNAKAPVVLFLGVLKDEETAVFLVNPAASATGDASCRPAKDDCRRILVRKGEMEHIDVLDASGAVVKAFELKLVSIRKALVEEISATASAARTAKVDLGVWVERAAPFDHDAETGLLSRVAPDALEAKLAAIAAAIGF